MYELWKRTRCKVAQLLNNHLETKDLKDINSSIQRSQHCIRMSLKHKDSDAIVLAIMQDHATSRGIPLIAAKARLMPHINHEYKKQFENELRDFLVSLDIAKIMQEGNEQEIKELALAYKILHNEGYGDLLAIRSLYAAYPTYDSNVMGTIIDNWQKTKSEIVLSVPSSIGEENNPFPLDTKTEKEFTSVEPEVFLACYPEATHYLQDLKQANISEYKRALTWCSRALHYLHSSIKFADEYRIDNNINGRLNCDDLTPMHQVLSCINENAILSPIYIDGHVALQLNGYDLVVDTFDGKIRTKKEFKQRKGYSQSNPSYYYGENDEVYLAEFDDTNEITSYKKVDSRKVPYENIASFLVGEAMAYEQFAKNKQKGPLPDLKDSIAISKFIKHIGPNADTLGNLGVFYRDMNQLDEAKVTLEQCTKDFPYYVNGWRNLGGVYEMLGDTERAIDCYATAYTIDPRNKVFFDNLFRLLLTNDKLEEAAELLTKRLKQFPHDQETRDKLCGILIKQGKYKEFKDEVMILDAKYPEYRVGRKIDIAFALNEIGKQREAKELYKKLIQIDPFNEILFLRLAQTFSTIDKGTSKRYFEVARQAFDSDWQMVQRILVLNGGRVSNQQMVQLFQNLGNHTIALMLAKRYSVIHKNDPILLRQIGNSATQVNDKQTALEAYESLLTLEANNIDALCSLAVLYNDETEAKELAWRAFTINPHDKRVQAVQRHFGSSVHGFYNEKKLECPEELMGIETKVVIDCKEPVKKGQIMLSVRKYWHLAEQADGLAIDLRCLSESKILSPELVNYEMDFLRRTLEKEGLKKNKITNNDSGWTISHWS